jgi:hypothetical protein
MLNLSQQITQPAPAVYTVPWSVFKLVMFKYHLSLFYYTDAITSQNVIIISDGGSIWKASPVGADATDFTTNWQSLSFSCASNDEAVTRALLNVSDSSTSLSDANGTISPLITASPPIQDLEEVQALDMRGTFMELARTRTSLERLTLANNRGHSTRGSTR